jgi:predicted transcriptional regulator
MKMGNMPADQKKTLDQQIDDEKTRLKERISKLIDTKKDTAQLLTLVDEEKQKSAKKIEQLKNQKRAVEAREKTQERKNRTRRLIQHGALAEKYFNCPDADTIEFENLLKTIVGNPAFNQIISDVKNNNTGQQKK